MCAKRKKFEKFVGYNGVVKYIRDRNDDSVLNLVLDNPNGPVIEDSEIIKKDRKIKKLQGIVANLKAEIDANLLAMHEEIKARLLEIEQLKQALGCSRTQIQRFKDGKIEGENTKAKVKGQFKEEDQ